MRFCVGLLILSLLFPPVTVASITMACLDDAGMMSMETPEMDHPMDDAHACCTAMAAESEACDYPDTTITCCPEAQVANHQGPTRTMPLSQYEAANSLALAMPFPMASLVDLSLPPIRLLTHQEAALDDAPPPFRTLFCTYLI